MDATVIDTETDDDRPRTRAGKPRLRSLDELDSRTAAARKAQQMVSSLVSDLGGDPTTAERQIAQRAALLSAMLEDAEARWVTGETIDLSEYGFLANTQRRLLVTLGLDRRAKDITPSVIEAIRRNRAGATQ